MKRQLLLILFLSSLINLAAKEYNDLNIDHNEIEFIDDNLEDDFIKYARLYAPHYNNLLFKLEKKNNKERNKIYKRNNGKLSWKQYKKNIAQPSRDNIIKDYLSKIAKVLNISLRQSWILYFQERKNI